MSVSLVLDPPRRAERMPGRVRSLLSWRLAAFGLILLVALAVRFVELRDVPRFTDETDEIVRGLLIARGEIAPLTNVDAYIGPLWSYLLAAAFSVAGTSSWVPRLLTVLAGLATVGAAFLLGSALARRLGLTGWDWLVGLGTALLLATSSFHALVSSRIGWSHSLT